MAAVCGEPLPGEARRAVENSAKAGTQAGPFWECVSPKLFPGSGSPASYGQVCLGALRRPKGDSLSPKQRISLQGFVPCESSWPLEQIYLNTYSHVEPQ